MLQHRRAARRRRRDGAPERINEDIMRFITVRVDELEEGPSAMLQKRDREERRDRSAAAAPRGDRDGGDGVEGDRRAEIEEVREVSFGGGGGGGRWRRRRRTPSVHAPAQDLSVSGANAPKIDYKDVRLLQRYVSERGKIVPSRITAVSSQQAARARPARSSARGSSGCCRT